MTTPVTKAMAHQRWKQDYYEYLRVHHPRKYAACMRGEREILEMHQFFASNEGKETIAELDAWMATPEMQTWQTDQDRKWEERLMKHNRSAYALLGVQPGATQTQIKRAYRQKARDLHPDKGGSEAAMKKLNAAYQKLLAKQP